MKNTVVAFLFFLFISSIAYGSISPAGSSRDSINLTGLIYNNNDQVKGVVINIYLNNKLYKKVEARSSNRFRTYVPKNAMVTVEITAPEFHAKRFLFNTELPDKLRSLPKYQFDIDLFKEAELVGVNTSILDFPVGLVEYDEKKGVFIRDKKYTKKMKKAYLELWEEAQMAERSGLKAEEEE
jgi:hypothetical protein